jgi:5-methylcytosine-specific restriction endonuclease McrA
VRKLNKPAYDPGQVYLTCISHVRDPGLKARLTSVKPDVTAAASAFDAAASLAKLHRLHPRNDVGGIVTTDEMTKVYTQRMAKKGAPGRTYYDSLLAAPTYGRCPLCGQGTVSTLDHHLPKDQYPSLTVVPINLIPACANCNKVKTNAIPHTQEEQTLHPYFDDVEGEQWLFAEVFKVAPAAIRFVVRPPDEWGPVKAKRIKHHFQVFRLGVLYTSYAAEELTNIKYSLEQIFPLTGVEGVKAHLQKQKDSYRAAHLNSWQTAMYGALEESNWFCEGGFSS